MKRLNKGMMVFAVIAITLLLLSFGISFAETLKYTYDDLNRLIQITHPDGKIIQYTYDEVGNRLQKTSTIDTTAPVGSISINGGAAYTNNTAVTLTLSCTDNTACYQMQFSNDSVSWSSAEAYATSRQWTLASGEGGKTVSVKYGDVPGNWSAAYSANIILDTTLPIDGILTATPTAMGQITLNWSGFSDNLSGTNRYILVYAPSAVPSSCSSGTQLYTGTGTSYIHTNFTGTTHNYRVCAVDNAENISIGSTASTSALTESPSTVEVLVVAGGGGGAGGYYGGGGGAGGLGEHFAYPVTTGTPITVIVGAGGSGGSGGSQGGDGGNSVFGSITAYGGGGGGKYDSGAGRSGGSGGGGAASTGGGGSATAGFGGGATYYGNSGGSGAPGNGAGGGGGAGSAGKTAGVAHSGGGDGGDGRSSSITGTSMVYATGGGGANSAGSYGGLGGSGNVNGGHGDATGSAGAANTGAGGGGQDDPGQGGWGGGSGVVIIRYPNTYSDAASTTGSVTFTNTGGYKIYKWTGSGSITW